MSRAYRTGDPALDAAIEGLLDQAAFAADRDVLGEMLVTVLRLGRENVDRGDRKLVNAALKELRYAFSVFAPYRDVPKLSIFGSARIAAGDPAYESARLLGAEMADRGWMVMTGAGPGIMAAGVEGAGRDRSFGINIDLPFEASANEFIADDPKLINFRYFFTRKVTFMKESYGFALLPGGFGTMDEAFELLTLMQTGKSQLVPVVLFDPPGSTYWERWHDFVVHELAEPRLIGAHDLDLVCITDDLGVAAETLSGFYRTYHSTRYVGGRLVLRLTREVDDAELAELDREFADIVETGRIERIDATPAEVRDDDHPDLPRLALHFDRHGFARLRHLIDRLNALP